PECCLLPVSHSDESLVRVREYCRARHVPRVFSQTCSKFLRSHDLNVLEDRQVWFQPEAVYHQADPVIEEAERRWCSGDNTNPHGILRQRRVCAKDGWKLPGCVHQLRWRNLPRPASLLAAAALVEAQPEHGDLS